ncbi:MAG: hypothetical protein IIB67_08430 [Proteobacteria bacterium]|nr:hypothetical protein [Pseudomonadota bacterium]
MAEGIRIRHNVRRGQMLPVQLLFEPWPTNRAECGVCHTIHPCKVLHLTLDDTGAGLRESHVHDVTVTHEAPNYRGGT